jgi:dTDP-glucose 4,6-dehydratase
MKKKILVLGSSSFSGASIVDYLLTQNNYQIFGTYRRKKKNSYLPYKFNKNFRKFKEYKIDLLKKSNHLINLVTKLKPDIIIDFASVCMVNESWNNSEIYFQTNVLSKAKVIEYLSRTNFLQKYIYISTPEVFGSSKKFINENCNVFNPKTPYATSKLSFEILLKNYLSHYKFPLIISRFSNFYGPGQPSHRLIPKLISCIDSNIKFPVQGEGKSKRNYIFSFDFCNGINKVIKKGKIGETYHFSGDNFHSVINIIKSVCDLKSHNIKKLIIKTQSRIGQDFLYKLGSMKTRKSLNWRPVYALKDGIQEIIVHHNKYINKISKKDLVYRDKNFEK